MKITAERVELKVSQKREKEIGKAVNVHTVIVCLRVSNVALYWHETMWKTLVEQTGGILPWKTIRPSYDVFNNVLT